MRDNSRDSTPQLIKEALAFIPLILLIAGLLFLVERRGTENDNSTDPETSGAQTGEQVSGSAGDGNFPAAPTPTLDPDYIGIIPGHWQHDSGAVCPDGLKEVDVTTDVAIRIRSILEDQGYRVKLLPEHDPDSPQAPLLGFHAAALVSIHADSCDTPGASGFKVSRWTGSAVPAASDRLVDCLGEHYANATLLKQHRGSITEDMRNYYAFREIREDVPAAILELAFLLDDREFVDQHRYEMARGVAEGILCFIERSS